MALVLRVVLGVSLAAVPVAAASVADPVSFRRPAVTETTRPVSLAAVVDPVGWAMSATCAEWPSGAAVWLRRDPVASRWAVLRRWLAHEAPDLPRPVRQRCPAPRSADSDPPH